MPDGLAAAAHDEADLGARDADDLRDLARVVAALHARVVVHHRVRGLVPELLAAQRHSLRLSGQNILDPVIPTVN